jgi:hypothetical protein
MIRRRPPRKRRLKLKLDRRLQLKRRRLPLARWSGFRHDWLEGWPVGIRRGRCCRNRLEPWLDRRAQTTLRANPSHSRSGGGNELGRRASLHSCASVLIEQRSNLLGKLTKIDRGGLGQPQGGDASREFAKAG